MKIFITLVVLLAFVPSAYAAGKPVNGSIKNADGFVDNAAVSVEYNGHIKNTISNSAGGYLITFDNETDCKKNDFVTVHASKGSQAGSNSGPMQDAGATIDVIIRPVAAVPEFGGMIALPMIAGAVAFLFIKRAYLSSINN